MGANPTPDQRRGVEKISPEPNVVSLPASALKKEKIGGLTGHWYLLKTIPGPNDQTSNLCD